MRSQVQAREASLPTGVGPATASAREVEKDVPAANASLVHGGPNELQPPIDANAMATIGSAQSLPNAACGLDPRTGLPYRFNPETGQPCSSAQDRVVVRQPSYPATQPSPAVPEPTPEERRIAAAYQREQEAMSAPTSIRSGGGPAGLGSLNGGSASYSSGNDLAQDCGTHHFRPLLGRIRPEPRRPL